MSPRITPAPKPVIVSRMPPDFGNVGGTAVKLGLGSLQRVAYLDHEDRVSRSHTVVVTSTIPAPNVIFSGFQTASVGVRITCSNERGSAVYWVGAPCVFPAVGSRIIVDAMVCKTPYVFGPKGPTFFLDGDPNISVSADVLEGWSDYPAPEALVTMASPNGGSIPLVQGPVYVQGMTFKNQGTTSVSMLVQDLFSPYPPGPNNIFTSIVIPPGTTIGLGGGALGGFFQGVTCTAVNDLTVGAPYGGINTAGNEVIIDVFGNFITPSQGA